MSAKETGKVIAIFKTTNVCDADGHGHVQHYAKQFDTDCKLCDVLDWANKLDPCKQRENIFFAELEDL